MTGLGMGSVIQLAGQHGSADEDPEDRRQDQQRVLGEDPPWGALEVSHPFWAVTASQN
jgi:hypothetical protein